MAKIIDFVKNKVFKTPPHWNYRVIKRHIPEFFIPEMEITFPAEDIYYIAEVYYEGNKPVSYVGYFEDESSTEERNGKIKFMEPFGTSVEELKRCMELMQEALNRPVLDYEEVIKLDNSSE